MRSIANRVKRLEMRLTDPTGLVPHSEAWFGHWEGILDRYLAGENPAHPGRIPLEVVDRLAECADREMEMTQ